MIADAMTKNGWKVLQEVECNSHSMKQINEDSDNSSVESFSSRRVDIIAYNQTTRKGVILDPTIRMEQNTNQADLVDLKKKAFYEPCIPYFKEKLGLDDIEVIGLYVGARGTISKFFLEFLKNHALPSTLIEDIVTTVLKKSAQICVHHLFSNIPDNEPPVADLFMV